MPDTTVTLDTDNPAHPRIVFDSREGPPAISLGVMDTMRELLRQIGA